MNRAKTYLGLPGWLVACFAAAVPGAFFMPGEWHATLKKPSWDPPDWLFGPVWTALYTMMAVAAWLVWKRGGFAVQRRPLTFFLVQLALNAACLLAPYLAWVGFATILNGALWRMNS